jgi:hypothetical protein
MTSSIGHGGPGFAQLDPSRLAIMMTTNGAAIPFQKRVKSRQPSRLRPGRVELGNR